MQLLRWIAASQTIVLMLSGCAGSVIFGHTIGRSDSASTTVPTSPQQQSPVQPVAVPSTPAPPSSPSPSSPPPPDSAPVARESTAVADTAPKFSAVSVGFTSEAKAQVDADPGFDRDALLAAIRRDLQAHQMLVEGAQPPSGRTMEILIGDFSARRASNAVVLGYVLSNARLSGTAEIRDSAGRTQLTLNVRADRRLSVRTDGTDGIRTPPLDPLYRRFADVIVSQLTGVPVSAPADSSTQMPR